MRIGWASHHPRTWVRRLLALDTCLRFRLLRGTLFDVSYYTHLGLGRVLQRASSFASGCLLDIGCGEAPYRVLFAGRCTVCWGLDYTPTLLPRQLSLQAVDIVADALALPIAAESMDVVLMIELIEHIRAPNRLLQQARSVLRPGGILILTAPFLYPVHGAPDYVRFTELGLGSLCERNGFEIIRSESFGSFWGFLAQSSNIYLSRWPERSPLLALLAAVLRPVLLLAIAVVNVGLRPLDALDQRRDFALGHLIVAQKPIGQEKYGI